MGDKIINERNPKKIGLNVSENFGIADGLVKSDHDWFVKDLPKEYQDKIVTAEKLAIGWIETRTPKEMKFRLFEVKKISVSIARKLPVRAKEWSSVRLKFLPSTIPNTKKKVNLIGTKRKRFIA